MVNQSLVVLYRGFDMLHKAKNVIVQIVTSQFSSTKLCNKARGNSRLVLPPILGLLQQEL